MRSVKIIGFVPFSEQLIDFIQRVKPIEVEAFSSHRAIEPFDDAVLGWLSRLDKLDFNPFFSPLFEFSLMNSGPLSQRMYLGSPLISTTLSNTSMSLSAVILYAASIHRSLREHSSTMLMIRTDCCLSPITHSLKKSIAQPSLIFFGDSSS